MAQSSSNKNRQPDDEDVGQSLSDFLPEYELRIRQAAKLVPQPESDDESMRWVRTPVPNAIQWTVGKQWLDNASTFKYFRQYQVIRDFFELRCPICNSLDPEAVDCWDKTQMYLESEILLEWNHDESDDVCPKCRATRREFVTDGIFRDYNQLHGVVGMRGGKTATASIIATYIEHRIYNLHYQTPGGIAAYLQQLPNQPFEIAFIASSDVQSQDTIWAHYMARRKQSPWIQRYIGWIKEVERKTPKIHGVKPTEYRELDKIIENDHLNLSFNSLNSNSSGMAGRTRLVAYIDELSRFQNSESRLSGDEAYRVLENSLETTRAMVDYLKRPGYLGSIVSISSPIAAEDKSMRLLKQAPELKRMYAFHYPTWEFNPYQPRERFNDQFIKDALGARRDFGADPPAATNPLIEDPDHFRSQATAVNLKPTATIEYYVKQDNAGNRYKAARCTGADLVTNTERYIVFDAGLVFDTFAGACAHGEWQDTPDGKVWVTVFDWILRVLPQKYPDRQEVWFDSVIDIVKTTKMKARIGMIEFDRWNSAHLIQQIRDMDLNAVQKGTAVTDFIKFVADVNFGRVRMLPPEPGDERADPDKMSGQGAAYYELTRLERSPDLRKVFNPKKGERIGWNSDDIAQCAVHVHRLVQELVAVDQQGAARSPELRLRNEQVGGQAYGSRKSGSLARPVTGARGW